MGTEVTKNMRKPVVRLSKALYGHPKAGYFWERHCTQYLKKAKFEPVSEINSLFYRDDLKLLLTVYVDDFILTGPTENLAQGWEDIKQAGIILGRVEEPGLYL